MSTLLVIDDNSDRARQLVGELISAAYERHTTAWGPHTLNEAAALGPDVILMDIGEPDVDWAVRCAELVETLADVPLIVIAPVEREADVLGCLEAGAADWINRPANAKLLNARIAALLSAKRDREARIRLAGELDERRRRYEKSAGEERQDYRFLATHDPLTGLPTLQMFDEYVRKSIAQAQRHPQTLAVICLDLDNFKQVNDVLGHALGDQLLQAVSRRLRQSVRSSDMVARLGGDEFMILLVNLNRREDAAVVAAKIVGVLSRPHELSGQEVFMTPSVGISVYPDHGDSSEALIGRAEAAMRSVKDQGRASFLYYVPDENQNARERMQLEYHMRDALERGQFVLYYQPQVDARKGNLVGVEALIRWFHPELGIVPPGDFIPIAEASGLIRPLGDWVIREACSQKKRWESQGLGGFPMSVNVSFRQLTTGRLADTVRQVLRATGLEAGHLDLEITENTIMEQLAKALDTLKACEDLGVTISIDDFGTGYSSLSVLGTLPAHTLKIDQSFVRDIHKSSTRAAITRTIVAVAAELGLATIAEGVETEEEMEFLAALGCTRMQGYLFSRPIPADEFEEQWRDGAVAAIKLRGDRG
ncbi:MAG: EAL domain-containing protein [Myxococcota bacterium]